MDAHLLKLVDPLMVRRFTPTGALELVGGVLVMTTYDVVDDGMVTGRLSFDEPVVDVSNRIFQITTAMMMDTTRPLTYTVFPSRRWRNFRTGEQIDRLPDADHPLLYLGNPIVLHADAEAIHVIRRPEFLIKSGMELGY